MQKLNKPSSKQKGLALIVLVFILVIATTAYLVSTLDSASIKKEREIKTTVALAQAKATLMGWAIRQNSPGQLPCPEDTTKIGTIDEGVSQTSCSLVNPVIGRLPWRTLGYGDLKDGNGDRLWYVISTGFRDSPINTNTNAQLSINGTPNIVAIIFSVGIPLSTQSRPTPTAISPPDVTQYLDVPNNNPNNTAFLSAPATNNFNDRIISITHTELFSLVARRVLREIKGDSFQGLGNYYATYAVYPYADTDADGVADIASLPPPPIGNPSYQAGVNSLDFSKTNIDELGTMSIKDSFLMNGWFPLITYKVTTDQQQVTLTLNGDTLQVNP